MNPAAPSSSLSDATEAGFRASRVGRDESVLAVLGGFVVVGNGLMVFNDVRLAQADWKMLATWRVSLMVLSLVTVVLFRRLGSYRSRDWLLAGWVAAVDLVVLAVSAHRPPGHVGFLVPLGLEVCLHFVLLPLPLARQVGLASFLFSGTTVLVLDPARAIDPAMRLTTLAISGGALVVGALASWRLDKADRDAYAALSNERALKAALETTLAEVRTLRGLVPICSFCKAVRDPDGEWHSVEAFVAGRTHAQFSHSICPTCMEQRYPEEPGSP